MNRQQLLSRLGPEFEIVYTTGASSKRVPRGTHPVLVPSLERRDNVLVFVLPRWVSSFAKQSSLRDLVASAIAQRLNVALESRPVSVCWSFHPKFLRLATALKSRWLVYHAYDLYHRQGQWSDELAENERVFASSADLVIASSRTIADHLASLGAKRPVVVENAADFNAFSRVSTADPPDLADIPTPRIGYVGALNRKVDLPLLALLATRHPDWHLVLVGSVGNLDSQTDTALERMRLMSNVHFLGFKDHSALPDYVARMNVNLLAYRLGSDVWTEGIYPLKLHEYLGAGRPVVSADLPSVRCFSAVVDIAREPTDWDSAIQRALLEPPDSEEVERRRSVAKSNSWDARIVEVRQCLMEMMSMSQ